MMAKVARRALFALLVALAGCAPPGPPFASVAATLPPAPPGTARIFFYRWLEPYETLAPTPAMLSGTVIGMTEPGAVLYRDVAPGQYLISVKSFGVYPNQFKTVTLSAGEVVYVRVESLKSWATCGGGGGSFAGGDQGCADTFVIELIDPNVARFEMADLRFIPG